MANTQTYTGDGTTTTFYFTFPFFGTSDVKISVGGATQTSDDFAIYPTTSPAPADTPYTGGRIEFAVAPSNGATIKIWRNIEMERHIDYQPTAQPQSHQLNQDVNQCIEILKELAETLTNIVSLANVPTLNELLSELTTIQNTIGTLATQTTVDALSDTVDDHTSSITNLGNTVGGHTTAINTLNGYDYVVEFQSPTANNNYTWYRKYKSGWVEQGGQTESTNSSVTVTLPVEMVDTNYTLTGIAKSGAKVASCSAYSTTSITLQYAALTGTASCPLCWHISGMAAA